MTDIVQKIKNEADIVELISDHVPLKKSGSSYIGLCPFHNDTKPSMHVSPSKGIFKCFSCGVGGDVFKFWSEYHQKDFKETIKELAKKYGIPMEFMEKDKNEIRNFDLKIQMHELAADYYHNKLMSSQEAQFCREYLESRDIKTETLIKFKLGYSPNDKVNKRKLIDYLQYNLNVSESDIQEAGLAIKSEKYNKYYDRFRGRLMIPICDERGKVIAFGARILEGDDAIHRDTEPKYLNSPETQIYQKGEHLYGLHLAKEAIRKNDAVIVVEGYFDLIAAHQAGILNVVANQGTALTPRQAKLLTKFCESKKIYICFDTDKAGEQATDRAVEIIMQVMPVFFNLRAEIRILRMPDKFKDIDELLRSAGADRLQDLIRQAPLLIDYQIEKITNETDFDSPLSKGKSIGKLSKYLDCINNQVELAGYIKLISEKLSIDEFAIWSELNKAFKSERNELNNPYETLFSDRKSSFNKLGSNIENKNLKVKNINGHIIYMEESLYLDEQEFLVLAIGEKAILEKFLAEGRELITDKHKKILEILVDISFENPDLHDVNVKYNLLRDRLLEFPDLSKELADLGMELEKEQNKADVQTRHENVSRRLHRYHLNYRMKNIISKIKEIELTDQPANNQDTSDIWIKLQQEKKELIDRLQRS